MNSRNPWPSWSNNVRAAKRYCVGFVFSALSFGALATDQCILLNPNPEASTTTNVEGTIKGSISALIRKLIGGSGEITGRYNSEIKNVIDKVPTDQRGIVEMRYQYLLCQAIFASGKMSQADAIAAVTNIYSQRLTKDHAPGLVSPEKIAQQDKQAKKPVPPKAASPTGSVPSSPTPQTNSGTYVGSIDASQASQSSFVIGGTGNVITQNFGAKPDKVVLEQLIEQVRQARLYASLSNSPERFPAEWARAETLHARGVDLLPSSTPEAKEALEMALGEYMTAANHAMLDIQTKEFRVSADRQQKLLSALHYAQQAKRAAERRRTPEQRELFAAAENKLTEAMNLGMYENRPDDALQAYQEAKEMYERLGK
jgi:hypothetical protein